MGSNHPAGPTRLFPSRNRTKDKTSVPLSILDATCARFTDTGAVWLFDAPSRAAPEDVLLLGDRVVRRLRSSFVDTLDDFPQWAGRLHWAPFRPGAGDHTARFQRCVLTYGDDADPGVGWGVVRRGYALDSIVPPPPPPPSSRSCGGGVWWWDNDAFPQGELVSPAPLALAGLRDDDDDAAGRPPCMRVQVTLFACGGYGVGVRLAHPVADAQSMMVFMHQWAANSRRRDGGGAASSSSSCASPWGEPVFDPPQLDARAAGDIDCADGPDPALCARARALPMHRFSWWDVEAPGYPPRLVGTTRNNLPPPGVLAHTALSPSTAAPWHTWDLDRPAASAVLHFTGEALARLRDGARADVAATGGDDENEDEDGGGGNAISRSDALLAHLFRLVTRARRAVRSSPAYAPAADDAVFLDCTLEARRRVAPPLPAAFLGSPLLMAHIQTTASSTATTGALARRLRRTLRRFTPDAVAALLHEAAFEAAPQRLWRGFLGARHLMATSWLRTRPYDVDFGIFSGGEGEAAAQKKRRPRYVHAVMGKADGVLVLLDPAVEDGGVDVAVYLDGEAMGELRGLVRGTRI